MLRYIQTYFLIYITDIYYKEGTQMPRKERVSYLWRYEANKVTQKKINAWMNQQSNIRDSQKCWYFILLIVLAMSM
jgi:hypothetical protein